MSKNENEELKVEGGDAEATPKSKRSFFMGGGLVSLVALAYVISVVAIPSDPMETPSFEGPFVAAPLVDGDVQVNMAKVQGKKFLVLNFKTQYSGYDETYAEARITDPLFQASMIDALIRLGRQKTLEDVEDDIGVGIFAAEIRDALDPLLFPVHVGNETSTTDPHEESGICAGSSNHLATMRSGFKTHKLKVDAVRKTISLDGGPEVSFDGSEEDLMLENGPGQRIYVDVSDLEPEFVGEVHVGTFGKLNDILFSRLLTQ